MTSTFAMRPSLRAGTSPAAPDAGPQRDITKARALIVDGNPTSRSVQVSQLRDLGVTHVKYTGRASDARVMLERSGFDIVLCDYHFEDSNTSGQDLLDELRRENLLPYSTVFIMVTAEADYAKVMEAAESALDGYLLKPYTGQALSSRVLEARNRKRVLHGIFSSLERGQPVAAARLALERFNLREPYWMFCGRLAAELFLQNDQIEQAAWIYDAVVQEKAVPWARLGLVRTLLARGETSQARRSAEALVNDLPTFADAYDVLGRMFVDQGDLGSALDTFRTAAKLTPGCLLRLQHCGTLAFYEGHTEEAIRLLDRVISVGARSRLFDALTLFLLCLARADTRDPKGLAAMHEQIRRFQTRHVGSQRLQRFERAAGLLESVLAERIDEALVEFRDLAGDRDSENFDVESATVLLAMLARLPPDALDEGEAAALVRQLGRRCCVSRAVTEVLMASGQRQDWICEILRECHAHITQLTEKAVSLSVRGHPTRAVQDLLAHGRETLNARLIDMAQLVAQRHRDSIEDYEALRSQTAELQARWCRPITHLAGVLRSRRAPGGLALRGARAPGSSGA